MTGSGVGYLVHTPETLPDQSEVSLHVTTIVREDAITLYGFTSEVDQEVFGMLIKVTGVGPQLALALLHDVGSSGVVRAVLANDTTTLVKAKGLGKKRAETLCLALKDMPASLLDFVTASEETGTTTSAFDQLVDTLENLGYERTKAHDAVQAAHGANKDAEESTLLRAALLHLRGGQ